ncbi:MAG: hypothetical protein HC884_15830 [Chloroflexaceae bacterium]|nr:hypothetical protein [Chloroflexaceae bacterium]
MGLFTQVSAGRYHSCGIHPGGTLDCWGDNTYGQVITQTSTFLQVSAGRNHTCGIHTDGSVTCWGLNNEGQATPPDGLFLQVSAGRNHTCGVRTDGSVTCWGDSSQGNCPVSSSIPRRCPAEPKERPIIRPSAPAEVLPPTSLPWWMAPCRPASA